ncbi:MAG: universal stress protein, partial [Gemmatimonadota bacterium]|nr:universal stress protein [Gemmatimonadota bacterium]
MTTKTATLARPFPAYTGAVLPSGPLLVASDLSGESDAAYPIAARLALQSGADVEIVSVLPPYVMPMYGFDAVPIPVEVDAGYRTTRAAALLAQQRRLVKEPRVWSTAIISGEPGRETTERARLLNARLIIAGRGRHAIGQRLLGGETVLRMLQLGD